MITREEFYLEVLKGYRMPGGEAAIKKQGSEDRLRGLVRVEILSGGEYENKGHVVGVISGIELDSDTSVHEGSCYE